MKNIPILVDGPNYVNRIIDLGINPVHIARQLSLESLAELVSEKLREIRSVSGRCESVEFVCSKKQFGPKAKKFTDAQQSMLVDRLRGETGVYIDIVDIPGSSEKGVDHTISGKMEDYAGDVDAIALVTEDRDFIPTLKRLRHKVKVIVLGLRDDYPTELRNEAYATVFLQQDYRALFKYHYPRFSVIDFNEEKCAELYSEADDRTLNQIRVSHDGYVYISLDVGADKLHNVKFQFETLCQYNGYVGPKAASDAEYIGSETKDILLGWKRGARGYIDFPVEAVWKDDKQT